MITSCLALYQNRYCSCQMEEGREGTVGNEQMITSCLALYQNRYCSCQMEEGREGTVGNEHMITSCLALYQNNYCSCQMEEWVRRDSRRWAYDHFLSGSLSESLFLLSSGRVGKKGQAGGGPMITSCLTLYQNYYCSCQVEEGRQGTVRGRHMITSCLTLYQNHYWSCQVEEG